MDIENLLYNKFFTFEEELSRFSQKLIVTQKLPTIYLYPILVLRNLFA